MRRPLKILALTGFPDHLVSNLWGRELGIPISGFLKDMANQTKVLPRITGSGTIFVPALRNWGPISATASFPRISTSIS